MDIAVKRKPSATPLREQVLAALRGDIMDGRLAPGRRVTERELTERLGVSRTVLRESLRQLGAEGLVSLVPNKGAVIRDLTVTEARELYRIREMLEGLSARLFAESADTAAKSALDVALQAVCAAYAAGDPKAILEAKNRYYAVIHEGMESAIVEEMLSIVLDRVWRWRALGLSHPKRSVGRSEESVANLVALTEAIRTGDGDRAEAAARHEARSAAAEVILLIEGRAAGT